MRLTRHCVNTRCEKYFDFSGVNVLMLTTADLVASG